MQRGCLRVLRLLVAANPLLVDNQFTRRPAECEFCRGWPWLASLSIECAVVLQGPVEEVRKLAACCIARCHEVWDCWVRKVEIHIAPRILMGRSSEDVRSVVVKVLYCPLEILE